MEVICIREMKRMRGIYRQELRPEIGDIDTVIGNHAEMGKRFYFLQRFGMTRAYAVELFARFNGPDERIRLEEWKQEKEAAALDAEFRQIVHEMETA
jgi:hypothetical protein